ncbi:MAG: hypothetical protein HQM10_07085 [Candidatus Riflebacteria bacterium]|nr:hypothetical protein [Candidatus Riflebacteria bacterium]
MSILNYIKEYNACDFSDYRNKGGLDESSRKIIDIIKSSNLKERDKSLFPTGLKLDFFSKVSDPGKMVLVLADNVEPGCFRDTYLLQNAIFAVFEAVLAVLEATSAKVAVFLFNPWQKEVAESVRSSLNILLSDSDFNQKMKLSDIDFEFIFSGGLCNFGDPVLAVDQISGRQAVARKGYSANYISPSDRSLLGKPVLVMNLDTLIQIPLILRKGPEWYRSQGDPENPGTKILSVSGAVKSPGIYEFYYGTNIEEIIAKCSGEIDFEKISGVIPAGYGSGIFPIKHCSSLTSKIFEGSGALYFYSEKNCPVAIASKILNFLSGESCGFCIPCREGTRYLVDFFSNCNKKPVYDVQYKSYSYSIKHISEIASLLKMTSRCDTGRRIALLVNSLIEYFPTEMEKHFLRQECSVKQCWK